MFRLVSDLKALRRESQLVHLLWMCMETLTPTM